MLRWQRVLSPQAAMCAAYVACVMRAATTRATARCGISRATLPSRSPVTLARAQLTPQLSPLHMQLRRLDGRAAGMLPYMPVASAALLSSARAYTSHASGGVCGGLYARHAYAMTTATRWPASGGMLPHALVVSRRGIRVRGKEEQTDERSDNKSDDGDHTKNNDKDDENDNKDNKKDDKDEKTSEEQQKTQQKKRSRSQTRKRSFADHVRGLRNDYATFPEIYNSANAVTFVLFTVFCLCSTGSNTEERWWLDHWALDHHLRPYNWLLHSFLTNNFLSMTYAMMLLHSMCHLVLPTIGSRGLLVYVGSTAVLSGAVMWLGNRLVYGAPVDDVKSSSSASSSSSATAALESVSNRRRVPEKQFGPWDVVSAMFVMQYLYFGITPVRTLNSFSSWMRYACWVGQLCIMYYDWQPTFVGAAVGMALCRGVPRFRIKPVGGA